MFDIKEFHILPPKLNDTFCTDVRTNSDYFLIHNQMFGLMTGAKNVYCAVRNEYLNRIQVSVSLEMVKGTFPSVKKFTLLKVCFLGYKCFFSERYFRFLTMFSKF